MGVYQRSRETKAVFDLLEDETKLMDLLIDVKDPETREAIKVLISVLQVWRASVL